MAYMGIRDSRTTHPMKIRRQERAKERQSADNRSPQEQLAKLDECGYRAIKERKKLKSMLR